jgi:hypothetical protein
MLADHPGLLLLSPTFPHHDLEKDSHRRKIHGDYLPLRLPPTGEMNNDFD